MTLLGCIADDFTGATDLAGLLARGGARVSLRIGAPQAPAAPGDAAPVEVVALKIRTAPAAEAVAAARAALAWLREAGAERIFWKYCSTFDSTPEGNIGPVAEALMDDLGVGAVAHCPAFPENGRRVFMGRLFVGEVPLDESPMRDHPLTPMRDASLLRLLAPQTTRPAGLVSRPTVARGPDAVRARLAELAAAGVGHAVLDAIEDADLDTLAEACRDMPLIAGGSAFAAPLPALWRRDGRLERPPRPGGEAARPASWPALGPGAIALSGSCSAMTRAQVAAYAPQAATFRLDPLALAEAGPGAARAWLAAQDPAAPKLIYATAEPEAVREAQERLGAARAGALVEEALATLARDALALGVSRFVVAGGETSGAVTGALGVSRLEIGAEIAPGVPWTLAEAQGRPIALALKSGNFGAPSFFADAFARLDAA